MPGVLLSAAASAPLWKVQIALFGLKVFTCGCLTKRRTQKGGFTIFCLIRIPLTGKSKV